MKALVIRELGAVDNLSIENVHDPRPDVGEVIVKLKAAALNHRDVFILQRLYPGIVLPAILGSDGAGIISDVGSNVSKSLIGQEVVINPSLDWGDDERAQGSNFRILGMPDDGTFAEMMTISASNVHPKPAHLTFEEAAALPLAALTAFRAVVSRAKVRAGDTVLITGIGGGVSTFALLIANTLGAKVVVTSGSEDKIARAKELGAFSGVNYKSKDWGKQLIEILGGANHAPNVVIDSTGGETLETAVHILKPAGRLVFYGATTGLAHNLDLRKIFFKQLNIMGSTMGSPKEFAAMVDLFNEKQLRPLVDKTFAFDLEEVRMAFNRMIESGQFGKIVLTF